MGAFDEIVRSGKVRHVGASNYGVPRLVEAIAASERGGLASFAALQVHYNLVEHDYEHGLQAVCREHGLACVPYFGLARGFLTGKYRSGDLAAKSDRPDAGVEYANEQGFAVLAVLDEIAAAHATSIATVSLAWLAAQETVASPIASARTLEQLADLLAVAELELTTSELARLDLVSRDLSQSSAEIAWLPS
jgi:aryl-alcohol dehydrogenase-like predicted oxidoreductase